MKTSEIDLLNTLRIAYKAFDSIKPSMTRTFMTLGREILTDNFSARGIYADHQMNFYKYMSNHATNPDSDKNAVSLYGAEKLQMFLDALNKEVQADADLKKLVKKIITEEADGYQTANVAEQVNEALQEIAAEESSADKLKQVSAKATKASAATTKAAETLENVQEQTAKIDKPSYGLNLDIDAVFTRSATDFLLGEKQGILKHVTDKIKTAALQNTLILLPGLNGQPQKQNIVSGRLHKDFKEVLEVTVIEKQSFLGGPAGSGKTSIAAQVAEALALPFGHISCSAGMSEAHLLGRMIADGTYISSRFVELYENGGVFLADEVDAADANTLLILNSGLANGYISVPNRAGNPTAKRHKDFYLIGAANTFGNGSAEYSGREILDAAFMDRFAGSKIDIDYDTDLEAEICVEFPAVARRILKIRDAVKANRMKRIVSTRVFAAAVRSLSAGRSEQQFFTRFFTGWSEEEVKKACA